MSNFNKFDIGSNVADSTIEVFDTMLSIDLNLSDNDEIKIDEKERIVGAVNVAGKILGTILIEVSHEFSKMMTASMLDIEPDEVEGLEDIKDLISELCNIVGGSLKSSFCDADLICELSPPSFTTGNDFIINPLNTERLEHYVFLHDKHPVIIQVGVSLDEDYSPYNEGEEDKLRRVEDVDVNEVLDFDIKSNTIESTINLFDTMLSIELIHNDTIIEFPQHLKRIVGSVSLIGILMGKINILVSHDLATEMTASMLGMEPDEIDENDDIKDVISEICNIIGGGIKSKLCDVGLTCSLSPPSFTMGSNFAIESQRMLKYERFAFKYNEEIVHVEVGIKLAEGSQLDKDKPVNEVLDNAKTALDSQQAIDDLLADETKEENTTKKEIRPEISEEDQTSRNLDLIFDIPVEITVELGQTKMKLKDLLKICQGSVIAFLNITEEPVDILVNNTLIARGEVIVEKEKYGVRIVETISRMKRLKILK